MKQNNEILRELEEMESMLATLPRTMPYSVPNGYFETLNSSLAEHIGYESDPDVHFPKQIPYSVPAGYFDAFPRQMLQIAQAESAIALPRATIPLKVPNGYFEQLPQQILATVRQKEHTIEADRPAKVIPFRRVANWRPFRYAVAAMLVIAIGLGLYQITATNTMAISDQLAQIPKEDVRNYVLYNIDDFETEELMPAVQLAFADKKSWNPASHIADERIIQYLDETGWDMEL